MSCEWDFWGKTLDLVLSEQPKMYGKGVTCPAGAGGPVERKMAQALLNSHTTEDVADFGLCESKEGKLVLVLGMSPG